MRFLLIFILFLTTTLVANAQAPLTAKQKKIIKRDKLNWIPISNKYDTLAWTVLYEDNTTERVFKVFQLNRYAGTRKSNIWVPVTDLYLAKDKKTRITKHTLGLGERGWK